MTPLEGAAIKVKREPLMRQQLRLQPIAWLPGHRIVYAATSGDSRNHWSVTLSERDWQVTDPPERVTAGAGLEGPGSVVTVAGAARLAFSTVTRAIDFWSVSLSRDGLQPAGAPVRLTQDTAIDMHPALTPDGRTLIFSTDRRRQRALWARDLATGREAPLVSLPGKSVQRPVVSMDGSKLAFCGPPNALHHAHSARLSIGNVGQTVRGFSASRDRIVFNMSEMNSNIWMTELPAGR